jgi:putative Mg2+ transporter-C (MgtC) family protein
LHPGITGLPCKNKRAYNTSMHILDLGTFVIRLGIALILGTVVGLERQWHHRMAGTRTNALVSVAAAAFAMVGIALSGVEGGSRVIGQIVSGVGFLGAGVIFKEGGTVHGLNTAATIWCSAAVGALAGIGYPLYAATVGLAAVLTNIALRPLAYKWGPANKSLETNYQLELTCESKDETKLRAVLLSAIEANHLVITSLTSQRLETGDQVRITAGFKSPTRNDQSVEHLVARIGLEVGVTAITWRVEIPSSIE